MQDAIRLNTQLSIEKQRLETELAKSKELESKMSQDRERFDSKLDRIESAQSQRDEKIESIEKKLFTENKLRNLIGEEMKDFHDIDDDACGRISLLESNKESSDQAILKVF